ncbi:MAG: hypothetical protein DRJ66_04685 [Thermoprotei archaeon]|nr:MAG: hypothetical protein DRJ66_04685 [Thermoprotei archaeon]RLF20085.1 MAG: hypothetical protein DRZ82_03525 [Thermoprotei archaeon]
MMVCKISRRDFLKIIAGASLVAAGLGIVGRYLGIFGRRGPLREKEIKPNPYIVNGKSLVSFVRGHDVNKMVEESIKAIGGIEKLVKPGSIVLIKPNVGFSNPDAVASPKVVSAVIRVVQRANPAKIIIAESAVRGYDTSRNFEVTGIAEVAKELGVDLIDLDRYGEVVRVKTNGGVKLKDVRVFKQVLDADVVISIPKLKRHSAATVTISLKNMMGAIPDGEKGMFHILGLHQCIADLNTVVKPDLSIVDATEVMTVSGPGHGKMVPGNAIIAGGDPVAVDLIAARYLFELEGSINPLNDAMNVKHIRLAAQLGVGTNDLSKVRVIERRTD